MKVVGTIVEFNPLHNGHLYAINEIKKQSNADLFIVVMSGEYTMRGDLSLFDPFTKAKHALYAGIDLVVELPFANTVEAADTFAKNAVLLLNLLHVEELWFGSEHNSTSLYEEVYHNWQLKESQQKIAEAIQKGASYKEATSLIINLPSNDMLGFCYYKAIVENQLPIKVHTIKRIGAQYEDLTPSTYASAKGIRHNLSLLEQYCPTYVKKEEIRNEELIFQYLKYAILSQSKTDLKEIFLVEEGLENALLKIIDCNDLNAYISSLVSRRYTQSRIKRMLAYVLFHITKQEMQEIKKSELIIRVLGANEQGFHYLNKIKKEHTIYTNIKDDYHPILDMELKIAKVLDAIYHSNLLKKEQQGPIRKEKL